jgi:PelA/Pel-15E family pectate lyase
MQHKALRCLLVVLIGLSSGTVDADDRKDLALQALEKSLAAMTHFQRHGGWGTSWSLDQKVVWGEHLPIPDDWITVQSPATPTVAGIYLRAGQVLNKPRWITVAGEAHEALCRLQSAEGGFPHEGPPEAGQSKQASFDDGVTTRTLDFLIDWWHYTNDSTDRVAVERVGAFILTSQYAKTGGWPQSFPVPSNYGRCITFNDGNFSNIITALFKLYRETGDMHYRAAAHRGGECILRLQGGDGQSIWAQQYDPDTLKPAWARKFEPPGYTPAESSRVCDTLIELFVETGDNRYIESLGRALKWYETHQLENGKYARLYEPDTQRPVYGRRDKAVKVYDFADACEGYGWQGTWYPHKAKKAWDEIQADGAEAFRQSHGGLKTPGRGMPTDSAIDFICSHITDSGHWTRKPSAKQLIQYEKYGVAPEVPMIRLRDFNSHVSQLLDYIELAP